MSEIHFEIQGDTVVKYTPVPEAGENCYKTEDVMTKEIFQECYKKWVEPQEDGKGGNMKDLCELCTLNCPTSGCTILSHESCLKEVIQLIKPSVTNGEVFQAIFPNASVFENQDNELYPYIDVFLCGDKDINCYRKDWWNAPYKAESGEK